jgi:hypothetical protein
MFACASAASRQWLRSGPSVLTARIGWTVCAVVLALCVLTPPPARAQPVEWNQRAVAGPSPRLYHAMAYDSARHVTVLFGGSVSSGGGSIYNGDTWEWDGTAWTQRSVSGPSPRRGHAMAYDAARGVTVLFGGDTGGGGEVIYNGETWEWNGTVWTQRAFSPEPRYAHALAYDSARHVTVLFGGFVDSGINGETWEWNGTAWSQRAISGPSARGYHATVYDTVRGVIVLFGGYDGSVHYGDTWEWNGTVWTQRGVGGPSPRYQHDMAYDAARGVTVLFGGYAGGPNYGDTWEWDGSAWTQRLVSGPSARRTPAMAYDAGRGVTVLFGGYPGDKNGETWEFGDPCVAAPSVTVQPLPQIVCPGGSASFTVTAAGDGQFSYQWRESSANLADEPNHISGARAATLTIVNITVTDVGNYECVVSNACGSVTSDTSSLTICPADFNCDGVVNSQDFFAYVGSFFGGLANADFNHDGMVNSQDFFDFLAAFFSGC